jgi:hypothetical protein
VVIWHVVNICNINYSSLIRYKFLICIRRNDCVLWFTVEYSASPSPICKSEDKNTQYAHFTRFNGCETWLCTVKSEDNSKVSVQGVDDKISQDAREYLTNEEFVQSGRGLNLIYVYYSNDAIWWTAVTKSNVVQKVIRINDNPSRVWYIFFKAHSQNSGKRQLASPCPSVRPPTSPPACNTSALTGRVFMEQNGVYSKPCWES